MNAITPITPSAASTYDLPLFAAAPPTYAALPQTSFVTRLVATLTQTFNLTPQDQQLATQLLYSRPLGAIARHLQVPPTTAQQRCRALFATTHTDGRETLFELALRLTTMHELS